MLLREQEGAEPDSAMAIVTTLLQKRTVAPRPRRPRPARCAVLSALAERMRVIGEADERVTEIAAGN